MSSRRAWIGRPQEGVSPGDCRLAPVAPTAALTARRSGLHLPARVQGQLRRLAADPGQASVSGMLPSSRWSVNRRGLIDELAGVPC